jgi:hypothetical protein
MTSNTIPMPRIQFIANLSRMGDRKLVIYIPAKYHEEMRKSFEGKPMLITCQEAIPENKENE